MTPEFTFWIFLLAVAKALLVTGIAPGFIIVAIAERLALGKRAADRKAALIKFLTWGGRTAPGKMSGTACIGAGARPDDLKGAA